MIARFRALLPYSVYVIQNEQLLPWQFTVGDYAVTVYPPMQANADASEVLTSDDIPIFEVASNLAPVDQPVVSKKVMVNERNSTETNLLQIDFYKSEFDRTLKPDLEESGDPNNETLFTTANSVLARWRAMTRSPIVTPVRHDGTIWKLQYLTDDGEELESTENLYRFRTGVHFPLGATVISGEVWALAEALPFEFRMAPWETLILDAERLLPDIGPVVVMAFSALETFIDWALDEFARGASINNELWTWIIAKRQYHKQPSIHEKFGVLLTVCSGHSLKAERPDLWQAFEDLYSARNAFAHRGVAVIERKSGSNRKISTNLTPQIAMELLGAAKALLSHLESLLPGTMHRPTTKAPLNIEINRMLMGNRGNPMSIAEEDTTATDN